MVAPTTELLCQILHHFTTAGQCRTSGCQISDRFTTSGWHQTSDIRHIRQIPMSDRRPADDSVVWLCWGSWWMGGGFTTHFFVFNVGRECSTHVNQTTCGYPELENTIMSVSAGVFLCWPWDVGLSLPLALVQYIHTHTHTPRVQIQGTQTYVHWCIQTCPVKWRWRQIFNHHDTHNYVLLFLKII